MQLIEEGWRCVVYGVRVLGEDEDSRRSGGTIKVRMLLSALEVRRLVPSGDLEGIRGVLEIEGGITCHCALLK